MREKNSELRSAGEKKKKRNHQMLLEAEWNDAAVQHGAGWGRDKNHKAEHDNVAAFHDLMLQIRENKATQDTVGQR